MTGNTHPSAHPDDPHYISRAGWLRAAVLGANDGIVSVSSILTGVAAANSGTQAIMLAGIAGLTAGALSMAAGEYVSVSSQTDIENADRAREAQALATDPETELEELADIYIQRGLSRETAMRVATELHAHDALEAHMRDELGLSDTLAAQPLQAALASGLTFTVAGFIPLAAAFLAPADSIINVVLVVTVLALALLGAIGARAGGAPVWRPVIRVTLWGIAAMAVTAGIGALFGVATT